MGSDLLGISVTGLRASQAALSTTGHNISNAGTDGYSRQRVDVVTNPATIKGGQFVGNGANVNSIDRIANSYISQQLRVDSSLSSDLTTFFDQISQLDNLLSNETTGLTGGLQSFFAAMQNGADDPTSIPARQLIISESENLADRFNSIDARFQVIEGGVRDGMKVAVESINTLVTNIAQLNTRITSASSNGQPNDLLDKRDEALRQLSELVPIQTFEQGQGQVNVLISGGSPLVVGSEVNTLSLTPGRNGRTADDIILSDGGAGRVITKAIKGGELGALVRFRDESLSPAYNNLGRIAVVVADEFNRLHQQGITSENEFGRQFFNDVNDPIAVRQRVVASSANAAPSDRQLGLSIRDISALTTSNYHVELEPGGVYRITRENDGAEVASGLLPGDYPFTVKFDGMELKFAGGSFTAGDEFTLQPFAKGARNFASTIANPEDIAFASPIVTDAEIGNTGGGKITPGSVVALEDINGNPLPLFAEQGKMSPPLVIQFTSERTYDVLDNSDPANPKQLDPPIRNQRYIPGIENQIFPGIEGQKQLSMGGDLIGLPEGRSAVTRASLTPPVVNPVNPATGTSELDFSVSDFSGGNSFSFVVELSDTVLGGANSQTTVTIDSPSIQSEDDLLRHINSQLGPSGMRAYIAIDSAGNRSLAFNAAEAGYANVSVHSYSGPGTGDANALMNIGIEGGASFTTDGGLNGIEGAGSLTNGYPAERITLTKAPSQAGLAPTTYTVFSSLHGSARELANQLSNVPGVEANAFSYAEMSDFNLTREEPLQIALNGRDLVEYRAGGADGSRTMVQSVPDPATDPVAFNQYLAQRINEDESLKKQGIYAVAGQDVVTGKAELRVYSSEGDDLSFSVTAASGSAVRVSDGEHNPVTLSGQGNNVPSQIVVGGQMDVRLDEDMTLATRPPNSLLFGDTTADDFTGSTYLGLDVSLSGAPDSGDRFTLDFNQDAASDNRNALNLVNVESSRIMNGNTASLNDAYGTLVEKVGITTNSAKVNSEAAKAVLEQTESLRNSISGVNLDEEAANLIRYEQFFQANAQVISVARSLFDTLIGSL
ncbi:MAG TPA: flagellar hook-associated protein FlgK [Marinagarivorans sp.]